MIAEGAFSSIKIDKSTNRLIKTYVEHRGETDSPYIHVIGNNVYVINWICENDIHKRLLKSMPAMFPKLYMYEEQKYLDVDESKRPPIPEPLQHRKPESLMLCRVEMEYLPFPSLVSIIDTLLKSNNEKEIKNIVKQWFSLQLQIIKEAHVLPFDIHVGNMLYDKRQKKIYFVDYAFYEFFNLIDRLEPNIVQTKDVIYWFDPTKDKHKIFKDYDEIKSNDGGFELTDEEVRDLFMFRLMWFANFRNETKLHHILSSKLGINECIKLHVEAMKELNFSQKHISLISEAISNANTLFSIGRSVRNWLGGPYGKVCSSHKLLTYLKIFPEQVEKCYNDIKTKIDEWRKMNRDEFWDYYVNILRQTKSSLYCQLAYTLYLKYEPIDEYDRMIEFVKRNLQQTNHPIYRCETTDRFNDEENKIVVGKVLKWENLIPGTENKQYALSYLGNGRGTSIVSQTNPQHYLFAFNNIKACHLHDYYSEFTTYSRRYNASNVNDTNRLKCFFPNCVVVSNEWIINPLTSFVVTNIYTIESPEMKPPTMIANKPIKEEYTGNMLKVNVVELVEKE